MSFWINITSGRGPEECCLFVKNILSVFLNFCIKHNVKTEILTLEKSEKNNYRSVLISVESDNLELFEKEWIGTFQWIKKSPYRLNHKRKNWFISIDIIKVPEKNNFNTDDIQIESMRSTGAGGQNVNKTDSAIRIKHKPTGITVIAREERSQQQNKRLALSRLNIAIEGLNNNKDKNSKKQVWNTHNELIRGNPKITFTEDDF